MTRPGVALLALLFAWAPLHTEAAADVASQYASLAPKKAIASDPSGAAVASNGGHASDAAAAVAAFQACESRRRALGADAPCEVTRLNDDTVTTGAEIRARVPQGRHPLFLWRFESPSASVYLAGSMHVMKPTLHPLPVQLERAFAQSDHIAVEVNTLAVSGTQMQDIVRRHALFAPGRSLADVVPAQTLARLDSHLADQGIPFEAIASMKPALLATQLAVDRLTALGYFPQFGVDQYFITRAGSRPVLELETIDAQIALLTSPTMDVQNDMLALTLEQMDAIEPILTDMVVAWLSGDGDELRRVFDEQSPQTEAYAAFNRRLLDERNVGMADSIERYLATPGRYFVLVGAAHLAGEGSIVDVLRRRGIRGARIHSDDQI